jgi:hypothetical protein
MMGWRRSGSRSARVVVAVALAIALAGGSSSVASGAGSHRGCKPHAATGVPTAVTPLSAVLHGTVADCHKKRTVAWFVIRESIRHLATSDSPRASVPAASGDKPVKYSLSGLTPAESVTVTLHAKIAGKRIAGRSVTFSVPQLVVATLAAASVTGTSAVLNGSANPGGASGVAGGFRWSAASGGTSQQTPGTALPADAHVHAFSFTLAGLTPDTQYQFDAVATAAHGVVIACGCVMKFTTGPGAAAALKVTAPATATAGQAFAVSATATDGHGVSLGDVTAHTTFTISPDGSCSGSSCTATLAGPHVVHGVDGAATGEAAQTTTITPGPLDHLVVSPASASVCSTGVIAAFADFSCPSGSSATQVFTAEGFDQYGNDLGDETANATFSISSPGQCTSNECEVGSSLGSLTVTAQDGTAMGFATLTGEANMTCQGEHYDVNGEESDGCEVSELHPGHTIMSNALSEGSYSSCKSGQPEFSFTGNLPSDARAHADPTVTGFDAASGSAPFWAYVTDVPSSLCDDVIDVTLTTTGEATAHDNSCYQLHVITDKNTYSAQTGSDGTATIAAGAGAFSDGTNIDFEITKLCSTSVTENISWTIAGYL